MKRILTFIIGGALLTSQVAWAQNDRNRGRGGGRGQSRPAAAATAQTPSVAARQSVTQARGMARAETSRAVTRPQTRVATRPTQTTVVRTDREGTARSTTSRTATRSTANTQRFDRDGRGDWNRDRDGDWRDRDRDRDWSDRRYYRPPIATYRNWDRGRVYSWNNNRWRWYGGSWVIYDVSPSVVYTTEALPVVGSSITASVQEELQDKGYSPGPADGVMGSRTRSAIAEYQDDRGLAVTGTINNPLLRSLGLM
jgi:hypothetical protein